METSTDRVELEAKADFNLLGQAAVQKSAQIARGGDVERAQVHAKAWHNHMMRGAQTQNQMSSISNYAQSIGGMYSHMN